MLHFNSVSTKFFIILALSWFALAVIMAVVISIGVRNLGVTSTKDDALLIARLLDEQLGTHDFAAHTLKNIEHPLQIAQTYNIESIELFNKNDSLTNPHAQRALTQKRDIVEIVEHLDGFYVRIHVPHLDTNGDVEGIMSVTVNAIAFRQKYMQIVWWMLVLILVFIVLEILVLRRIFSPYIAFYEDLCENILETDKGNFKKQLHTKLRDEVGDIALLINTTNAKIDAIICNIESRIPSLMHYQKERYHSNPLVRINEVIDELVDVYQFKRHIEAKSIDEIEQSFIELFDKIGLRLLVFVESTNAKDRLIYPADQSVLRAYYQSLTLCRLPFETRQEKRVYPITFQNKPALWTMFYITTNVRWECVFEATEEQFGTIFPLLSNYFSTSTSTIENRYLLDLLKANSQKDALTGLNNRAFLDEFSDNITSQAQRIELEYAVMMVDIDFFKKVNDNYGHNIGDKVLRELALVFTQAIRTSDLAVRYGGEEFLILLLGCPQQDAIKVAQKIKELFETHTFESDFGESFCCTLSIGIARFPHDANNMALAIKYADIALYAAKNAGRNQILCFEKHMIPRDFDPLKVKG